MEFFPSHIIRKKRFGHAHTREEIHFMIEGFARGTIPDYQAAAWLMAICCRDMNTEETTWLTEEMRDSGTVIDLKHLGVTVDKHSTGGVGDKVSLILAPLVAAAGVPVPMMAGRSLGHTGGTLDKLESISGFSVRLSFDQFRQQVGSIGLAIMGQTEEICPADRKLYALRDVTGTIDSLPLICGSILSKKLAEGMSALVLDVKVGSGAFMKSVEQAETLARAMINVGGNLGRRVIALLTRMDEPLGRFVGNANEVQECLDVMDGKVFSGEGKRYSDLVELTLALAGQMIFLGGKADTAIQGEHLAARLLSDGSAKRKFVELCRAQGGDLSVPLPQASAHFEVRSPRAGFMHYLDVEKIGSAAILLGAGRRFQSDVVDFAAGIEVFRHQGDQVAAGDPLFKLSAATEARLKMALPMLEESFSIVPQPFPQSPLIAKVLT